MSQITTAAIEAAKEVKKVGFRESVTPKHKAVTFFEGTVTEEIMKAVTKALSGEGFRFWMGDNNFTGFVSRNARLWVAGFGNRDGKPSLTWGWYFC